MINDKLIVVLITVLGKRSTGQQNQWMNKTQHINLKVSEKINIHILKAAP